jgi:hypothetical protein
VDIQRPQARKLFVLCVLIACLIGLWWRYFFPAAEGKYLAGNDFLSFYAGGRLAFSRGLFDPRQISAVQLHAAGMTTPELGFFSRVPFVAAFFWPLAQLPYRTACAVWQTVSLAALVTFLFLWRPPTPRTSLLVAALFLPPLVAVMNGQDVNFLLLWIAVAAGLLRRERDFAAGVVFSLCLAKFHLFLLLPVLIVSRKMWRFGGGFAAGAAALLGFCFAAQGWDWPVRYVAEMRGSAVNPGAASMPTLHALLVYFHSPWWVEIFVVPAIAACLFAVVRRVDLTYALAALLTLGPLLAVHAYLSDCALLLPAGLALFTLTRFTFVRIVCAVAMSPPVLGFLKDGYPRSIAVPILLLVLFAGVAYESLHVPAMRRQEVSYGNV